MKPHITKSGRHWLCVGKGTTVWDYSPIGAFEQWQVQYLRYGSGY